MEKYQTKSQVLIDILLAEVEDDLMSSNQRMHVFKEQNDLETLEIERETNNLYKSKIAKLEELKAIEKNCSSSHICEVQIGYRKKDGVVTILEEYESDTL